MTPRYVRRCKTICYREHHVPIYCWDNTDVTEKIKVKNAYLLEAITGTTTVAVILPVVE